MGFDVLVNGFRDHGWSGKSEHDRTTWGWIYPYDLLGAWDYAVNDPDGKFGGPIDPKQVAIAGISLGAMVTSTAFALDQRVHAVWLDSGPASPRDELHDIVHGFIPSSLSWLDWLIDKSVLPVVMLGANLRTGV